ncbi:glycoside hydrolase family 99-like domain-containing protein [Bacteroides xylanisolvens]|uniref:glycoside hydrolase family 99-like domain-containing protein n=1 Tax=Bacteroides xylanisolvens TaxID=371601 RepID=UPI0039B54279
MFERRPQYPNHPKLIIINSWNKWVERSYLMPNMEHSYVYLNAVKRVMNGEYEMSIKS